MREVLEGVSAADAGITGKESFINAGEPADFSTLGAEGSTVKTTFLYAMHLLVCIS